MEPPQPASGNHGPAGPLSLRWLHLRLALIGLALGLCSAAAPVVVIPWLGRMTGQPPPWPMTPAMQVVYVISLLPAIGGAVLGILAVRQADRSHIETLGPAYTAVVAVLAAPSIIWLILELCELPFAFADCSYPGACS